MTNLFKSKPRIFKKELTEKEVYETERYYLLKVVDISRCLEKELSRCDGNIDIEEFMEKLFYSQQNCKLSRTVYEYLDYRRLNIELKLEEMPRGTSIAVIIISKKCIKERVKEVLNCLVERIFDVNDMNDF